MKPTFIARQSRRPSGLLGQIVGRIMARETQPTNAVVLQALDLHPDDRVLEVGFGHGRTLAAAARVVTTGRLAGVDPSEVMLRIARKENAKTLREGRMELHLGRSEHIPFRDWTFNKAFAVHTIYFWPRPERDLAEIYRVMMPGGRMVLGFRPSEDDGFVQNYPAEIYHFRSVEEVESAVLAAGFSEVETSTTLVGEVLMACTVARGGGG